MPTIEFTEDQQRKHYLTYVGRNGAGKCLGIEVLHLDDMNRIVLTPLNSKGIANCYISLPADPAIIGRLCTTLRACAPTPVDRWNYRRDGEHPFFCKEDWAREASEDETILGYQEWVEHQIENVENDVDLSNTAKIIVKGTEIRSVDINGNDQGLIDEFCDSDVSIAYANMISKFTSEPIPVEVAGQTT